MYAHPILLPPISNREDLLRTIALFDDDTGQGIDFSGRTLARPGDFVGANWTVTVGNIVTASVTQLTIKDYPFGNEMQAISPIVGQGLAILPGAFAIIADPTAKNTMFGYVTSYAPATGALVCQVGSSFQFEIRGHDHDFDGGYGTSSSIGTDEGTPVISAALGNYLSVIDIGRVQIRIPEATIKTLRHRTYRAAMTMFDGYDTRQLFVGKQPIIGGGVTI